MLKDENQLCPYEWAPFISKKACGRKRDYVCDSTIVPTGPQSFQQVCGRFRGFQWGNTDAFAAFFVAQPVTIDKPYVDGVSITYSEGGQRHHVFTYAAGLMERINPFNWPAGRCPCAGGANPPLFVRTSDYYCESGNPDKDFLYNQIYCDALWDGKECRYDEKTCCDLTGIQQPWFCRDLGKQVSSDLEIRLCSDEVKYNEDVALESYELYVR